MACDYRKMLIAYIAHVGDCEGTDFLGHGPRSGLAGLTEAEDIEMAKLRDLDRDPRYRYYDDAGNPISGAKA